MCDVYTYHPIDYIKTTHLQLDHFCQGFRVFITQDDYSRPPLRAGQRFGSFQDLYGTQRRTAREPRPIRDVDPARRDQEQQDQEPQGQDREPWERQEPLEGGQDQAAPRPDLQEPRPIQVVVAGDQGRAGDQDQQGQGQAGGEQGRVVDQGVGRVLNDLRFGGRFRPAELIQPMWQYNPPSWNR